MEFQAATRSFGTDLQSVDASLIRWVERFGAGGSGSKERRRRQDGGVSQRFMAERRFFSHGAGGGADTRWDLRRAAIRLAGVEGIMLIKLMLRIRKGWK